MDNANSHVRDYIRSAQNRTIVTDIILYITRIVRAKYEHSGFSIDGDTGIASEIV